MSTRIATVLLQLGLVAVVIIVLPIKVFELDRYFVPKELVLHALALAVALLVLARTRTVVVDAADALLGLFLIWSVASALLATNARDCGVYAPQRSADRRDHDRRHWWDPRRVDRRGRSGSRELSDQPARR